MDILLLIYIVECNWNLYIILLNHLTEFFSSVFFANTRDIRNVRTVCLYSTKLSHAALSIDCSEATEVIVFIQ